MTALPIIYELLCITLKILAAERFINLPLWSYPLLTTKPPLTFLVFFFAAIYIKLREKYFINHGKTLEDYHKFLMTNTNSFQFSITLSVIIFLTAIVDIFISAVVLFLSVPYFGGSFEAASSALHSWGFAETPDLIGIIPLLLLFSYTKTHKKALIDIIIPVAAAIIIVFIYLEGFLEIICTLINSKLAPLL